MAVRAGDRPVASDDSEQAGATAARRRAVLKFAAAAVFVAVFTIGQSFTASHAAAAAWWSDLSWTLASLIAGLECLRTARALSGDQCRAWMLFAAGCLAWFAGMLVWDYRELIQQEFTPFPDYSDIGFMALAPLFVGGLMHMSLRRGLSLTLKDFADLGVILAVVTFGTWLVLAGLLDNPALSMAYRAFALALPILFVSAFIFALLSLLRHATTAGKVVLALFLGALGLHAVTDCLYAYSLLEETYQSGHYLDVYWIVAFAMTYSAAVVEQTWGTRPAVDEESLQVFNALMRRADTTVFTGLFVAAGAVAFWNYDALRLRPDLLAPFLVGLGCFLGLREWANHRIQMRLTAEVRASERELNRILDYLDDTYYRVDLNGIITRISRSAAKLMGYRAEELVGRSSSEFNVTDPDRERMIAALEADDGVLRNYETQLLRKDGSRVWISTNAHYVRDDAGNIVGVEGTSRDISAIKDAEENMRKLSGALQQSADAVMITDREGVVEYVNPAFEETTGYSAGEVVGRTPSILSSGEHDDAYYGVLWATIRDGEVFRDVMVNKRKDGTLYYEDKTITPLMDEQGHITHFVSTGKDISEQMKAQERLQFIAHHDTLTGLPNRTLFLDRVAQVLARTQRHGRLAAVLFMDLDQFKNINDSLGHEVGDKLLLAVAERLQAGLRPGDTVARFGGDEFVILLDDVNSYNDITQVVEKLRGALQTSIPVEGISLHVTGTIGISVFPHDGDDGPALLKNADNAMYRAKEQGRDTYAFYSEEMSTRVHARLSMENKLRNAVDKGQFDVYYQPQIDIVNDTIVGVEALLRWHVPEGEAVGPEEFVPLLEDTGLIIPVGDHVLDTACNQVHAWNQQLGRSLEVAVNISARQFTNTRFPEVVRNIVADSGLDPGLLQLEMTESVYLRTTGAGSATVRALDQAGIRLAIDDFGTGYSALNYFKRLPIQVLKIDRSFIRDLPESREDAALTIAALAMAEGLELRVVAEGVETRAQLEFLREHGCRFVQGYLFSEALPAAALAALLEDPAFPACRLAG